MLFGETGFKIIADDLPTLCWIADATGYIIWYNKRWYDYCGTVPEDMEGWGWTSVHDPDVLPEVMERWQHSISTHTDFEMTFPLKGHDGVFRPFLTRVVPIYKDNVLLRWLGINIDVSEQYRIQQELRMSEERLRSINLNLEEGIEERAHELRKTEEQLRQSQKMEAVGQLTGGLAHDFNNILTAILGNLELLQKRICNNQLENIEGYVASAIEAGNRAAALTQRLLAFSRRQTLDPKVVKVYDLILSMKDLLSRSVGPTIKFTVNVENYHQYILVDGPQLESALLNLCINARDAMPKGGEIQINLFNSIVSELQALEYNIKPGRYVNIEVVDKGCGMDRITISKAFDPFYTTKPIGQGTGLGLSMVYGFCRQSKGHVVIDSEKDVGTQVTLFFPLHEGNSKDNIKEESSSLTLLEKDEKASKGTVLIVDDEPIIRILIIETLREENYTVLDAATGVEAVKFLENSETIDLLITDVGLPDGMNGKQVADRAREVRPDIPIMFITGYAEQVIMEGTEFDSRTTITTKPFRMGDLLEKVNQILASSK